MSESAALNREHATPERLQARAPQSGSGGAVRLYYESRGDGPAVVLLHGFPETHVSWALQVDALVDAGYRVVTPDLRGYGKSEKPRHGYDLPNLAADVERVIEELGDSPVRLVGHDWGGAVVWHLLERCPEKIVNATILNCPHPASLAKALRKNPRQIARSWYIFFFQLPVLPEQWLKWRDGRPIAWLFRAASSRAHAPPREIVDEARKSLLEGGLHGPLAYYRTAFRRGLRRPAHAQKTRAPRRPASDRPVTVIWGEQDTCLGIELLVGSERYAKNLVVHRIADAGHFVHQERPDLVNPLLLSALTRSDVAS